MLPVVILGSSRTEGQTSQAVKFLLGELKTISLCDLTLSPYDYEGRNHHDDFIPLIHTLLDHNPLILATPVYWYTMSAHMKIFLDRFTDILKNYSSLKNRLKNKEVILVVSSASGKPTGFEEPFIQTLAYLSLVYRGCFDVQFPRTPLPCITAYNEEQKRNAQSLWNELVENTL